MRRGGGGKVGKISFLIKSVVLIKVAMTVDNVRYRKRGARTGDKRRKRRGGGRAGREVWDS